MIRTPLVLKFSLGLSVFLGFAAAPSFAQVQQTIVCSKRAEGDESYLVRIKVQAASLTSAAASLDYAVEIYGNRLTPGLYYGQNYSDETAGTLTARAVEELGADGIELVGTSYDPSRDEPVKFIVRIPARAIGATLRSGGLTVRVATGEDQGYRDREETENAIRADLRALENCYSFLE